MAVIWQLSSKIIETVGRIAVLIVLARILSPKEFGIISAALIVINFSQTFSQFGVAPAIIQNRVLNSELLGSANVISCAGGVAFFLLIYLSAPIFVKFFAIDGLDQVIRAMSVCFILTSLVVVKEAIIVRKLEFSKLSIIDSVSFFLGYACVGIGSATAGFGIWSLVMAQVAQVTLRAASIFLVERTHVGWNFNAGRYNELLRFGASHSLAELGNFIALQGDNALIGRMLGAEALGLYSRAYNFVAMPARLFGLVFDKVLFSALSQVNDDKTRSSNALSRALFLLAVTLGPLSAFLVLSAADIIDILLGNEWKGVVLPFQILASTLIWRTSYKVCDSAARAQGANLSRAWRQWVYAAIVVGGGAYASSAGIAGVAIVVAAAILINFILMYQLCTTTVGCTWRSLLQITFSAILMSAGAAFAPMLTKIIMPYGTTALSLLTTLTITGLLSAAAFAVLTISGFSHFGWVRKIISGYLLTSRGVK